MKIIFLDIDGVLNGDLVTWEGFPDSHIDPALVQKLNRVIAATDAKIVISSSWRFRFNYTEMNEILTRRGFVGEIIGETPKFVKNQRFSEFISRGREIKEWLDDCAHEIESHIMFDDVHMMDGSKRLIKTDGKIGLTDENVERAIQMLTSKNGRANIRANRRTARKA